VSRASLRARLPLRILTTALGTGLFVYLVWRAGPGKLIADVVALRWGVESRSYSLDAFQNNHSPTTPSHSLFHRKRVIDWVFTRGPIRAFHPKVHSSVSDSDHYFLSEVLSFA